MAGEANLRVAVAGAGAFGRNHLRVLRELETAGQGVALVAAVEPDAARAAETASKYAIPVFASVDEMLAADLQARRGQSLPCPRCIIMQWLRRCSMQGSTCWWRSRWPQALPKPTT